MGRDNVSEAERLRKVFSENLVYYMRINNVSSTEVANRAGVGPSTVTDWTHGRKMPRMDKIEILADLFDIYKSDLIEKRLTAGTDDEPHDNRESELLKKFRSAPAAIQELVLRALQSEIDNH